MSIAYPKELGKRQPDKQVANFVTSPEFYQFAAVIAEVFPRNWAASFLGLMLDEEFMLTWVNGELRHGVGFTLVQEENVKKDTGNKSIFTRINSIYPELKLTDNYGRPTKAVPQLTVNTGRYSISGYNYPANVVVDQSGLFLSARYDLVSMSRNGLGLDNKASFGMKVHADGGISYFDELGRYQREGSGIMESSFAVISFYRALATVS